MKHFVLCILAAGVFAFIAIPAGGQQRPGGVEKLGWMAGCWEMNARNGAIVISEQWMKPAGGSMIGMSRTVSVGKTTGWEFLRIVSDADGTRYIAKPNTSSEETDFKAAKWSETEIVFENLGHDFPQRIIYRNSGADSLFARIEGTKNGKLSGMDIPMKRVRCE